MIRFADVFRGPRRKGIDCSDKVRVRSDLYWLNDWLEGRVIEVETIQYWKRRRLQIADTGSAADSKPAGCVWTSERIKTDWVGWV